MLLGGMSLLGCASRPAPCSGADACSDGVCHAGQCAPVESVPVAPQSRRVVLVPTAIRAANGGSFAVALGGSNDAGPLLVRFDATWGPGAIERAFLVLSPATGPTSTKPVRVAVARVEEAWTRTSAMPRVSAVDARTETTVLAGRVVRVDVTDMVREWARTGGRHHGFAVRAETGDAAGLAVAIESGDAPRLDVYVK
jgi:hypothetical protein